VRLGWSGVRVAACSPDARVVRFTAGNCYYLAKQPKRQDHPLSAVRDGLFNIFAATVHNGCCLSIRNLRKRYEVVAWAHLSWGGGWRLT